MSLPAAARVILGRYELGPVIGRGGAATVFRARDRSTGAAVAVKEIPVGHEMARRAGAEVRAASRLDHPGIVQLLDFGEDTHACYLVSELIEGASLAEQYRDRSIDDRALMGVMADVIGGLEHAHARGVVHRDLKPGNILVDHDGHGKLADFGIARIAGEAGLTQTGGLIGTMSYMAPEHARGGEAGPWSDVYSAALVLYEGLTGANPMAGANQLETLRRVGHGTIPSLAVARPDLPARLCAIVDAALSRDPRQRPSPGQLIDTLERVLRGAAPRPFVAPAQPRASRQPALTSTPTLGRVVCAAIVGGVVALGLRRFTTLQPGMVAAAAAAGGVAFGFVPWVSALAGWAIVCIAIGLQAPALGVLLGVAGLIVIVPFRGRGHLLAIPVAAPVIAMAGISPLIALLAGLAPGWARRIWVGVCAGTTALVWQLIVGAETAIDGGPVIGAWPQLDGVADPRVVVTRLMEPITARPSIAVAAGLIGGAALLVPAVLRLRRGLPRVLGVVAWIAAMVACVAATGGSVENALGALIPGGILVAVGAAIPWRQPVRGARSSEAVTLRANMEREPTA